MTRSEKHASYAVGDVVTIYEDPISKAQVEGKAELLERLIAADNVHGPGSGYWRVKFANGDIVERFVFLW